MKQFNKKFLFVFLITLVLFWVLFVGTFYYEWVRAICPIILFPFGVLWMVFEHYCLSLNDPEFSLPINDEITSSIIMLLCIIGQTVVYYNLYNKCKKIIKEYRNE